MTVTEKQFDDLLADDDLERLEAKAGAFNILAALGAVRRELRHSDFLAYLLDPTELHGLKSAFLRRFLRAVAASSSPPAISPTSLSLAELDGVQVRREWANIDILLVDPTLKLVVTVENKIDAKESSGQLATYRSRVQKQYPDHTYAFVFLTPEGLAPSEEDYLPLSYAAIIAALEAALSAPTTAVQPDVRVLVEHYIRVLKEKIVDESEIKDLAERIYARHKTVLNLIFEYRPDRASEASKFIAEMLTKDSDCVLDKTMKNTVRFALKDWDAIDALNHADDPSWSTAKRTLLFQFMIPAEGPVSLKLSLGPGDEKFRATLFAESKKKQELFNGGKKQLKTQTQLYTREIASADDMEGEYEKAILKGWEDFKGAELPKLRDAVKELVAASQPQAKM